MTSDTYIPRLWLSTANTDNSVGSVQCQCDGACPDPLYFDEDKVQAFKQKVALGEILEVSLSEDIFIDQIDDCIVALSSKGSHIVVLDRVAKELLLHLTEVSLMRELRNNIPWPNDMIDRVVALLLSEGILLSPQTRQSKPSVDKSVTLSAWLHLANGCNLSCQYCFLTFNGQHMDSVTAQRAVDAIFRSAHAQGYLRVKLKYAGGEPTLNFKTLLAAQQRAELLSAESKISLDTVLLTNGVRLNDVQIEELITHNIHVTISLDGTGMFHNIQRPLLGQNKNSFEHVSQTLERLLKRGISPHVSVTITNKNIEGLPNLIGYLLDHELRFSLNFYREPDDSPRYIELSFPHKDLISGLKSAYRVIENRLPSYSLLGNLSDLADLRAPHSHTCGVGRNYLVIDYDGHVSKCQMDMGHRVTNIDAFDPLAFVQADNKGIQNLSADNKEIEKCVWRYRCTGGCPRLTFQHTRRYDAKSPMCEIYEEILPEIVRLEALRLIRYEKPWNI